MAAESGAGSRVAGNARLGKLTGCEQRRPERERRTSVGFKCRQMSSHGDMRGETAKFLPACKAVPSTIFVLKPKVVLGVPLEMTGNDHPR